MARKLIEFHPEDLRALNELAEDKSATLQELLDTAVADYLEKNGRPTNLREALRKSATADDEKSAEEKPRTRTKAKSARKRR